MVKLSRTDTAGKQNQDERQGDSLTMIAWALLTQTFL